MAVRSVLALAIAVSLTTASLFMGFRVVVLRCGLRMIWTCDGKQFWMVVRARDRYSEKELTVHQIRCLPESPSGTKHLGWFVAETFVSVGIDLVDRHLTLIDLRILFSLMVHSFLSSSEVDDVLRDGFVRRIKVYTYNLNRIELTVFIFCSRKSYPH